MSESAYCHTTCALDPQDTSKQANILLRTETLKYQSQEHTATREEFIINQPKIQIYIQLHLIYDNHFHNPDTLHHRTYHQP